MKTVLEDMNKCTGCRACEKNCAFNSITMEKDEAGFLYPVIDENICTNCGVCTRLCPMANDYQGQKPLSVYAAIHRNEEVLADSSSGGMFTAIAQAVIEAGGSVFGCVMNDEFNVFQKSTYDDFKKSKAGPASLDPYFTVFRKCITYRESCYQCPYAQVERIGDFTIADYWKVETIHPEWKNKTGVSILCINSEKGKKVLDSFAKKLFLLESDIEDVQRVSSNMRRPSVRPAARENFYKYIATHGYETWANNYLKSPRYKLLKIYEALPRFIRVPLKKAVIKANR